MVYPGACNVPPSIMERKCAGENLQNTVERQKIELRKESNDEGPEKISPTQYMLCRGMQSMVLRQGREVVLL